MYRAMGQELPRTKRILELNPEHALVTGLRAHDGAARRARRPTGPLALDKILDSSYRDSQGLRARVA
jgi:HSP90 family molecular chaperone